MKRFLSTELFPLSPAKVGATAIAIVVVIAVLDIVGWILGIPILRSLVPGFLPMRMVTAIALLFSAVATASIAESEVARWKYRLSFICCAVTGTFGLLTVTGYIFDSVGWQPSLQNYRPMLHFFLEPAERMPVVTAALFFLYAWVVVLLGRRNRRFADVGHALLLSVSMVSYLIIIGYLFDISELYVWHGVAVAFTTSISFFCLCMASFCLRPRTWLMHVFTSEGAGADMARRLLPFMLFLPLIIGWFRLHGERAGIFGSEAGVAIVAVTYTVCFLLLLWMNARAVNRTDQLRRDAEAILEKNENMLNRAEEIAHLGSWQLDLVNNRLYWSDEVYRIFGISPHMFKATYEAFLEAVHPDDRADVDVAYNNSLREGKDSYEIEHRIILKSTGETRIVHEKCEHLRNDAGNVIRSTGMVHDLTERRKNEQLLYEERKYIDAIVQTTGGLIIGLDPSGKIKSFNNACEKTTGYAFEEVKDKPIWEMLLIPDDVGPVKTTFANVAGGSFPNEFENYWVTRDGKRRFIRWTNSVIRGNDGKAEMIIGTGIDITERKVAEEELLQSKIDLEQRVRIRTADLRNILDTLEKERQRFNDVLEMLPAYVILLTQDYHISFANRCFKKRFGEPDRRRCHEFLFGRSEPCAACETFKPFASRAPHHWEWTGPDNRNYDVFDFPFTDVDGEPLVLEMGIDITDRKKAEALLMEANEMKVLGQLTSGVAHEVRNPLNGILAIMGALSKELSGDDRFQPYMQHMRNQVTRLTVLMEDLLVLGRPLREETLGDVSMMTLVENTLATWLPTIQQSGPSIRFIPQNDRDRYLVRTDITSMTQVIINLLENACYHSTAGEEIVCAVKEVLPDKILFSIRDHGTGIPEEILPKIFDPFFTTRKGGTGLGLSIVRRIVDNHRGSISAVNNTDGPGATFEVTLPRIGIQPS